LFSKGNIATIWIDLINRRRTVSCYGVIER